MITLDELATVTALLDAGLPREEALSPLGLSPEEWESAKEDWLRRLAKDAQKGKLGESTRYLALLEAARPRAIEEAKKQPKTLDGPMPVTPVVHLSPLAGRR